MPLPDVADTYRLEHRLSFLGQEMMNVYHYRDVELMAPTPANVAEGWWTHVKTQWRAFQVGSANFLSQSIFVERLDGAHEFGEFAIPVAEQQGTRVVAGDFMPTTLAAAIRLQVASRVTRPGSKRLVGLMEADVQVTVILAATVTILQTFADRLDISFPAAGGALDLFPVIVGYRGGPPPTSSVVQDVQAAIALADVSHQVSRDHRRT